MSSFYSVNEIIIKFYYVFLRFVNFKLRYIYTCRFGYLHLQYMGLYVIIIMHNMINLFECNLNL